MPPVILVTCNNHFVEGTPAQAVKNPYLLALTEIVGATPLLIPALSPAPNLKQLAGSIKGILLTGARAHIEPERYGEERTFTKDLIDTQRDQTAFALIRDAIDLDIPLFAICRGFQEMNVALGGTLHQSVPNHNAPDGMSLEQAYQRLAHNVHRRTGGFFEHIGLPETFTVNSIHQQAINKVASDLTVEAVSEDGIVEAVSVKGKRFVVGVQWHPEGDFAENSVSKKLFESFRDAVTH